MQNVRNSMWRFSLVFCLSTAFGLFALRAWAQPVNLGKSESVTSTTPESDPAALIQAERAVAGTRLTALEAQLAKGSVGNTDELETLRGHYSELVAVFDIHLVALSESKKLLERTKAADQDYETRLTELKKDLDPRAFTHLLRLEEALLNSREDLANIQTAISQRQIEVETQSKLANDLAKQLRLEREKRIANSEPHPSLESTEVRERLARANSELRKLEIENLFRRETIEKQFGNKLQSALGDVRSQIQFSEGTLKQLTAPREAELSKIVEEIRIRQGELNRDSVKAAAIEDQTEKRIIRIYSDLLNIYLTLLRTKKDLVEFEKRLLLARFELYQNTLAKNTLRQLQDELRQRALAADKDILAQNRAIAQVLEEYISRQDIFTKLKNFDEINAKFRSTLRLSLLTLSEVGKYSNSMKYLRDSGDFSGSAERPAVAIVSAIWSGLIALWNFEVFVVDDSPITIGKLFLALLLFILGVRASRYLSTRIQRELSSRAHIDPGAAAAFGTISFYALLILSAIISLQFVRIPLTIFTLAGGALAIGVGFGSQTIVKNFFSGLILLFERPVRVGDIIQYDTTIGVVASIGARSTLIVTAEQLEVIVPNSYLIENTFTNWTLSNRKVRRAIKVGIAYGSPLREAAQALLAQAEKHNLVLRDPAPDVLFSEFGESAIVLTLRFWIQIGTGTDAVKVESDLRHMVDGTFREAGIEIAFPKRDMTLTSDKPLQVQLISETVAKS